MLISAMKRFFFLPGITFMLQTEISSQRGTAEETCDVNSCSDIPYDNLAMMSCTKGFEIGSKCTFTCPPYYSRVGDPFIQCKHASSSCGRAEWSARIPYCKALFCSEPPNVDQATFTCSRKLKLGSVCKYSCGSGYRMVPADHSGFLCYKNATWVGDPKPCCIVDVGPCPPNLKADVAFVADSSGSVGRTNFDHIKFFIKETIRFFQLGQNRARFAFLNYGERVYNMFDFNDKQNKREDLLQIVDGAPFTSSITYTGRALHYADQVVFNQSNGDRPDAENIIFLFSDGCSMDDFSKPVKDLKQRGVQFYVLAIGDSVSRSYLEELFGENNNYNIFYFKDYKKLGEFGPSKAVHHLCPYRCFNS